MDSTCCPNASTRGVTVIEATRGCCPGDPDPLSTTRTAAGSAATKAVERGRNTTVPLRAPAFRGAKLTGNSQLIPGITVGHTPSSPEVTLGLQHPRYVERYLPGVAQHQLPRRRRLWVDRERTGTLMDRTW